MPMIYVHKDSSSPPPPETLILHGKVRLEYVLKSVCNEWALVHEDWELYYGSLRIVKTRTISSYELKEHSRLLLKPINPPPIKPDPSPIFMHPSVEIAQRNRFQATTTATPTATTVGETSTATPATTIVQEASATPATFTTVEALEARTNALKKINDAAKALQLATANKEEIAATVYEAIQRVDRAKEELKCSKLSDARASKRIVEAEQAMRSALKVMDAALGSEDV